MFDKELDKVIMQLLARKDAIAANPMLPPTPDAVQPVLDADEEDFFFSCTMGE